MNAKLLSLRLTLPKAEF